MAGDTQKEVFNRIHYLLTGVLATAIPKANQFTACIGDLAGTWVVLGWETLDHNAFNIPFDKNSVVVIDLPDDLGYTKKISDDGYANGYFEREYTIQFEIIRKVAGFRSVIMGAGSDKGIVEITDDLLTVLTGTEDAMTLVYSGSKYVDEIVYPIDVTEGVGTDETGKVFARARKFSITYKVLDVEY